MGGAKGWSSGAFYTLVSVSAFTRDMTSGAGYIALVMLIFGRWNPGRAGPRCCLGLPPT